MAKKHFNPLEVEEGPLEECPECGGELVQQDPENCSCHINPPCPECENPMLECVECGWDG